MIKQWKEYTQEEFMQLPIEDMCYLVEQAEKEIQIKLRAYSPEERQLFADALFRVVADGDVVQW